jgi:transposase
MAYSKDTREMVLKYLSKGHTYEEARQELGVGVSTMKDWKRLLNETGSLEKRSRQRSASKYPCDELKAYIKEHPEAILEETAAHFWGAVSGAHDALTRVGITLKKRAFLRRA